MLLPQDNKKNTYADYLTWPENERWEGSSTDMKKQVSKNIG